MGSWTVRGVVADRRRLLAAAAAVVLVGVVGFGACDWSGGGGGGHAKSSASHTVAPRTDFLMSYSGAATRLAGLDPPDTADQVRDWIRTALAAHLGMSTAAIRDASYDTLPVRDQGFTDLADQQVGPGRELADTSGVLHLLVPRGDPHESRTIGLMLDQYRTDHGADPELVQIHHYTIDQAAQTVDVVADQISTPDQVRTDHGYVSTAITSLSDLTAFLAKTTSLSQLSVRDGQVWADGWSWPDVPSVPMTVDDISVLQKGYQDHVAGNGPAPGFSLDPLPPTTVGDIKAMAPSVSPDVAARLISGNWAGTVFTSSADVKNQVEDELYYPSTDQASALAQVGFPTDRTQLWAIDSLLAGQTSMSQERYDGGLAGTAVGNSLAYVDYVTKNWVAGVGQGVPTQAVGGFLADPAAVTPWSQCAGPNDPLDEHGRLWFGRNDDAFASTGDQIDIGAQAARLFVRDDGPNGTEVEPSYSFGRALQWWDVHQQDIEDYEPQYQRLDQIMRWSGALEWLTHEGKATLPTESQSPAPTPFKAWYTADNQLRERAPIDFVAPPSALSRHQNQEEALIVDPSRDFRDCGFVEIEGGVSLSDVYDRIGDQDYRPELPTSVTRAGLFDPKSTYDDASGTGEIDRVSIDDSGKVSDRVDRTLSMAGDTSTVEIKATGRKVIPLGDLKVWRSSDPDRTLEYRETTTGHSVREDLTYQGQDFGSLDTTDTANIVTVQWRSGVVDKARRALSSIQAKLSHGVAANVPAASDGVLYEVKSPDGTVKDRLSGPGQPWLGVTATVPTAGDALAFRIGGPAAPDKGGPSFMDGSFTAGPGPPPDGYLSVLPPSGDNPALAAFVPPPDHSDPTITVKTLTGQSATLSEAGDSVVVPAADPVLGVDGSVEGAALLRDFPKIKQLLQSAAQAKDGRLHAAALDDDGVALAADDGTVLLAPIGSDLADRVLRALGPDLTGTAVFDIVKEHAGIPDEIEQDDATPLTPTAKPLTMFLGSVFQTPGADAVYFSPTLRAALHLAAGQIIPEALPPTFKVSVLPVSPGHDPRADSTTAQPDLRTYDGAQWQLVNTAGLAQPAGPTGCPPIGAGGSGASVPVGGGGAGGGSAPAPTPSTPAPSGTPSAPASTGSGAGVAPGTVLMVSLAGSGQPVC
ncbi:acyl carrier protein [Catenulispora pinisilvae]|uniref:acyl carrier protein n=1 Tax=Catenulispora pinisilvae TaxID=2705253 RepID=UPI0018922F07|nr:acyl carrier protein [Catenulispora pinisilvae]